MPLSVVIIIIIIISDASARHVMLAIALGPKPNKVIYFDKSRVIHICLIKDYNSSVDPGQGSHRCCKAVEPWCFGGANCLFQLLLFQLWGKPLGVNCVLLGLLTSHKGFRGTEALRMQEHQTDNAGKDKKRVCLLVLMKKSPRVT